MRCERSLLFLLLIAMTIACSREETPAPPPATPATTTTTAAPTPSPAPMPARTASYEDAMDWFRATPGFRFTITEGGVRAEGELTRKTVGAEVVTMNVDGEQWRASSGPQGVTWTRNGAAAQAPAWGPRLYQRVTVAFDPKKLEGTAQLVEPAHYRFTNANTREIHDVWLDPSGRILRMTIGATMQMELR